MTHWADVGGYDLLKDFALPGIIGVFGFLGVMRSIKASAEIARETSTANAQLARETATANAQLAREQLENEATLARDQHRREVDHQTRSLKLALVAELEWNITDIEHIKNRRSNDGRSLFFVSKNHPTEIYDANMAHLGLLSPGQISGVINAYNNIRALTKGLQTYASGGGELTEEDDCYTLKTNADFCGRFELRVKSIGRSLSSAVEVLEKPYEKYNRGDDEEV